MCVAKKPIFWQEYIIAVLLFFVPEKLHELPFRCDLAI